MAMRGLYIGIDVGGTFTDAVVLDERGEVSTHKRPTTPEDPAAGVTALLDEVAEQRGSSLRELLGNAVYLGLGTTIATNTFLERGGARTGLLTTRGFGDTLLLQRTMGQWAGMGEEITHLSRRALPDPLVPRCLTAEIRERVDYKGAILTPLNENEVRQAVRELRAKGVEALAICFLWSFKNPLHEQRAKEIALREAPGLFLTTSAELVPVIGEYERMATTAVNAYLGPSAARWLARLEETLRLDGFQGAFRILESGGGVLPAGRAAASAVSLLCSGPSGGVLASARLAGTLGYRNVITTDMGGTSFDVSLIVDGAPLKTGVTEIGKYHILKSMVQVTAIGAGGGSIAWVDEGVLRVGPRSAGARPGPACYGLGGREPTVTDADLVLGLIDPDYFLGGRFRLDVEAARRVIQAKVADPLGMDLIEAAAGIRFVLDSKMADLLRSVTLSKGYDPREFVLFAYGGAGPTHCHQYGAELGVREIVIPSTATVHSAYGVVSADLHCAAERSELMRTPPGFQRASRHLDAERFQLNFSFLEDQCRNDLRSAGADPGSMVYFRYVDVRYRRQVNELTIPVPDGEVTAEGVDRIVGGFEATYERLYGKGSAYREAGIEVVTFRVEGLGRLPKPQLKSCREEARDPGRAYAGERKVYFPEARGFRRTPIYRGEQLPAGSEFGGPAILEYPGTTAVVGPGQRVRVDSYHNLILTNA